MDRGRPGFRRGSSCPALLRFRAMGAALIPPTGLSPSPAGLSRPFRYECSSFSAHGSSPRGPTTPLSRFGLLPLRSPLLGESLLISLPGLLRWFTSPGSAPPRYFIHAYGACLPACGLPHSAIRGSLDVCSSPRLFAAYRGLPRRPAPRHPPGTFLRLAISRPLLFLLLPSLAMLKITKNTAIWQKKERKK